MSARDDARGARRFPMIWLLAIVVGILVSFAAAFDIDQAVRANGQVISGSRTQVIQTVDGGMLLSLLVREGDAVKAGQKLAELEPDRARAGVAQIAAEVASKRIALERARAELAGRAPDFGDDARSWKAFTDAQAGIYRQRRQTLEEDVTLLEQALRLAEEEFEMNQRLFAAGDISRAEVLRAQRQTIDLKTRISGARNKYFLESRQEAAKLEDELASSRNRLEERESVLRHTELIAPMDGIVKYVRVTTVGGVLRPGDELMQLSPIDEALILEIKVNPADVAQLSPGLPVTLRFDAFDGATHGSVHGHLRYISPDTLSEAGPGGQPLVYYRAQVEPDWEKTRAVPANRIAPADLKPGMTATADVLTGRRTILQYLAKPVARAFSGALTQR
jgi:adhesin transport system membrane fusion protein